MNAATISRQLKSAGFRPSAPETRNRREGLFVTGRGRSVTVSVDVPSRPRHQASLAEDVAKCLREYGYVVTPINEDATLFRVEKEEGKK